jgi:hypothetical protein
MHFKQVVVAPLMALAAVASGPLGATERTRQIASLGAAQGEILNSLEAPKAGRDSHLALSAASIVMDAQSAWSHLNDLEVLSPLVTEPAAAKELGKRLDAMRYKVRTTICGIGRTNMRIHGDLAQTPEVKTAIASAGRVLADACATANSDSY